MSIGDTDFGVQVGIGVVGRVVTMLVAFLGAILLARLLGPSGYGAFYLLMAIVSFLDNPVTGWANACRKRLTEVDFPSGEAVGSTLIGIFISIAVVTITAFVFADPIARLTEQSDGWILVSVLFSGVVVYLTTLEVLKSTAYFGVSNWLMAVRDVIRVLAQAAFVLGGYGVAGMVGGMVIANLVVAPVALYLIGARPRVPSLDSLRQIGIFARSSIPNGIVGTAQNRMDVLLLGALASTSVVGNYEVSMKITMPAMFVAGVSSSGLMGRISNLQSKGEEIEREVRNNLAYASVIAVPLFFGGLVMGRPVVVTFFGSEYADAGAFVAGLALFHLFRSQKSILVSVINGVDRPELNLRTSVVVFSVNLLLGVGLYFLIGPIGVVAATVVSEALGYLFRAYVVGTLVPGIELLPRPLIEQFVSGALMAAVVWTARSMLPLAWWGNVIAILCVGGLTYTVSLLFTSKELRSTVRAIGRDAGLL